MANNRQLNKATWLMKLLRAHPRLTREEIDRYWSETPLANGSTHIPRRSFINLREDIHDFFNLNVVCDRSTYEYYLEEDEHNRNLTSVLLHNTALNDAINSSRSISSLIFIDDVPSSKSYLTLMFDALREHRAVMIDYAPYTRANPSRNVFVYPYCMKLFKQRWYVTCWVPGDAALKTYALDRIIRAKLTEINYFIRPDFDAEAYYRDSFGIVVTNGPVKRVRLWVDSHQAKYFRALPLHRSQQEWVNDGYSIFEYNLKISPDLVEELLSHGSKVKVLDPPELKAMMKAEINRMYYDYNPQRGDDLK